MTHDDDSVFLLNEYCLEIVLGYLDIKSQLNFAQTCHYFYEIFNYWAKLQHKTIKKDVLQLSQNEREQYFQLVGEYIVDCDNLVASESLHQIQQYCPNIQNLCYCTHWQESYRKIISKLTSLRSVHIYGRNGTATEMEESVLALKDLPNLKQITLEAITYDGTHLYKLNQLEELIVIECRLMPEKLIECFRSMQNLRKLSINFKIKGNEDVTNVEVFEALAQYCENLEELSFSDCDVAYEVIAKLPKLKILDIHGLSSGQQSNLIRALADSNLVDCSHLEYLIIPDYVLTVTDAKFLRKIKSLKTLQCWIADKRCFEHFAALNNLEQFVARFKNAAFYHVELLPLLKSWRNLRCIVVDINYEQAKQFVFDLIEVLRQIRNPSEQRPLELWAGKYPNAVGKEILQSPEYLDANDFFIIKWI